MNIPLVQIEKHLQVTLLKNKILPSPSVTKFLFP